MATYRLREQLRSLAESGAEFILVGGLAAVLQGAPVQTYDVDIVYSQTPANLKRLAHLLSSVEAIFRIQPERRLRPNLSHLAGGGHLNLLTRYGPLDLLGSIGKDLTYEDLLSHSSKMQAGDGLEIQVLDLDTLIELKEQLGGEKDVAVLPVLRETLKELNRQREK
jgi:predicted nucleotidyltransferase